jgi:hypothetical protein
VRPGSLVALPGVMSEADRLQQRAEKSADETIATVNWQLPTPVQQLGLLILLGVLALYVIWSTA